MSWPHSSTGHLHTFEGRSPRVWSVRNYNKPQSHNYFWECIKGYFKETLMSHPPSEDPLPRDLCLYLCYGCEIKELQHHREQDLLPFLAFYEKIHPQQSPVVRFPQSLAIYLFSNSEALFFPRTVFRFCIFKTWLLCTSASAQQELCTPAPMQTA